MRRSQQEVGEQGRVLFHSCVMVKTTLLQLYSFTRVEPETTKQPSETELQSSCGQQGSSRRE
jgi:hypothetical protein